MLEPVDIAARLAPLPVWHGRTPEGEGAGAASFADLGAYRDGGIFAGSFDGQSEWERHPNGDEVVHVLAGEAGVEILTADGPRVLHMRAGMLTVVPKGCWHRFRAPKGVTVLTVTPQPTEHCTAETPPSA